MKETKKQRKKRVGMNQSTQLAWLKGYKKPHLYCRGTQYVNDRLWNK